ncbi:LamG domain-containing protein [Jidongwangia harbinensis]|uniref:LamG domain-containing protein n=1 Tax=Jidongwangia harbinensis TaxID=2878561 RepID=UPI001CD98938|nr:LamG domain-containing protein [Jidongwangia harbinensis]MCA2218830.1 LamG domain-containing protein [Jidongwangia harbinensis]
MKLSVRLLTIALVAVPAVPALAVTATTGTAATGTATAATAAPATVAHYTFDRGATATGRVAENSGRGTPLTIRTADRGTIRFFTTKTGRYIGFPARCARTATFCPRALLQGSDDPDLDPGVRSFRWGATLYLSKAHLAGSSNVVQKGVATTESQWKLQVGATHGRAQCVVVGRGNSTAYIVRSSITVADSKWHHVQCVRIGGAMAVYVDGVARGRVAVPATLSILNDKPLRIGGPNFNTNSDMYHGYLDNVYARLG